MAIIAEARDFSLTKNCGIEQMEFPGNRKRG
jgi:hypothetical protein